MFQKHWNSCTGFYIKQNLVQIYKTHYGCVVRNQHLVYYNRNTFSAFLYFFLSNMRGYAI